MARPDTIERISAELTPYSRTLSREYDKAVEALAPSLSDDAFDAWCYAAVAIARASFRSWETAAEFLRMSPAVFPAVDEEHFLAWAEICRELTSTSSVVASAYIQSSPPAIRKLKPDDIAAWSKMGQRLHGDSWKSISLATRFFEESAVLLGVLNLEDLAIYVDFLTLLAIRSYEAAAECLEHGQRIISRVDMQDRPAFLRLARDLASPSWRTAQSLFKELPAILKGVEAPLRLWLFAQARRIVHKRPEETLEFLKDAAASLNAIPAEKKQEYAGMAEQLFHDGWRSVTAFLRSAPKVEERAGPDGLRHWFAYGQEQLEESEEAGTVYFLLQSSRAKGMLEAVSPGVGYDSVRDLLQMYCEALCGRSVRVVTTADLSERGVGWTQVERPATDGQAVHLPTYLEEFGGKPENFAAYKVLATHQTGHLEFGTFDFDFDRPAGMFQVNHRESLESDPGSAPFERFFDCFDDRKLAKDIFTVAEDYRIDHRIMTEYPGIRRSMAAVQEHSLDQRPVRPRPWREQLVELLVRLSLSEDAGSPEAGMLLQFIAPLADPRATVEDSTEATCRIYAFLSEIPNISVPEGGLEATNANPDDLSLSTEGGGQEGLGEGEPYQSPDPVSYRDELKPELVEAMARVRDAGADGEKSGGMSPEELAKLLEKSGEIDLSSMSQGEVTDSMGLFVNNIMREAGFSPNSTNQSAQNAERPRSTPPPARHSLGASDPEVFYYDEWDFRANDFRPLWCRLKEQVLQEGSSDFFERTLSDNRGLVSDIRRQFELIRPEAFKRIKNLQHGEEFDLDAVVDLIVQRRAGRPGSDKIYTRKNKLDRDVAVAFLLDMSASTDEEIEDRPHPPVYVDQPPPIMRWDRPNQWRWQWDEPVEEPRKRIIDVEKESIVLLIKALETIGDAYGIFGFSGYGRENVEFFVIKDLDEALSERVKRRVDKIAPVQGTRMGPAIRHSVRKLAAVEAKLKLLILVSDGRPQDHEYGKDRTEKDYAIHDTRMALLEAKRRQITPFCLTVDRFGHDYLKAMCGDIGYEVVNDIKVLPRRLPTLYRRLTT